MRRALGEYVVAGIKTTVPFFVWLLAQPEFLDRTRFTPPISTRCSRARNGQPFVEAAGTGRRGRRDRRGAAGGAVAGVGAGASGAGAAAAAHRADWKARARDRRRCADVRYEVEIDGRRAQVHVHRADGRFVVSVGDRAWSIDALAGRRHTLSLLMHPMPRTAPQPATHGRAPQPRSHEVVFAADPAPAPMTVRRRRRADDASALNGRRAPGAAKTAIDKAGPQRVVGADARQGRPRAGEGRRGRRVRGSRSSSIEAMKMENELRVGRRRRGHRGRRARRPVGRRRARCSP